MALEKFQLRTWLAKWQSLIGEEPIVEAGDGVRELWPVQSINGDRYFLKRLGPWRNLPVVSEYRMLVHLLDEGVRVPTFLITDDGSITAGPKEDSFVLMKALEHESVPAHQVPRFESAVGSAAARLHLAISTYTSPLDSYTENIQGGITNELYLSDERIDRFGTVRDDILHKLSNLPLQVIHGDLTPDNVLQLAHGKGIGFIDFDHLPFAPRIWDIAKYLSRRMRFRWCQDAPDTVRLDCVEMFVEGYNNVTPLDRTEIEALPGAMLAYNILEASYDQSILDGILTRRLLPDHADGLKDTLQTIDWQLCHLNAVSEAVRKGVG
ncbi:MAG: phosphotransferase enzyme family protein [Armatimonadota bacterium]